MLKRVPRKLLTVSISAVTRAKSHVKKPIPRADCYDDKGYAEGPAEAAFTFRGTALRRLATVLRGPAGIAVSIP